MTIKAAALVRSVAQLWTSYGACINDERAKQIKKSAEKATKMLRDYIDQLERARDQRTR